MEYSDNFLTELYDAVIQGNSLGHHSLVVAVCEKHKVPVLSWDEALGILQTDGFEAEECPECGWVTEGNYGTHEDHESGVCSDCSNN